MVCINPDLAGSLGGAAIDAAAGLANGIMSMVEAKKQREWQEKMYSTQLKDTRQMRDESWARQDSLLKDERAYNSPENQMRLRKEAGLNPALGQGAQLTDALTSVSATGASPEAPQPGNYSPAQLHMPVGLGSQVMGNVLQSKQMGIAQQNADTAKQNADTQAFAAKARSVRDLAEAGKLDADTANTWLDTLFKSESYQTRLNIVKSQADGLRWDNMLKEYDFNNMRPAVLANIQASTNQLYQTVQESIARIEVLGTEADLNRQLKIESGFRTGLINQERLVAEANEGYIKSMDALVDAKLDAQTFANSVMELDFYWSHVNDSLESVDGLLEMFLRLGKGPKSKGKKGGKSSDSSTPTASPADEVKSIKQRTEDAKFEWWKKNWDTFDPEAQKKLLDDESFPYRDYFGNKSKK